MTPTFSAPIGFYPTSDLTATRAFYEGVLGLSLVRDQGTCQIYGVAGGGYVGFCQSAEAVSFDPRVILTLVTDDVDEVYEALRAAGVETEAPPRHNPHLPLLCTRADGGEGRNPALRRAAGLKVCSPLA